jgi:hypothetical protein
MISSNYSNANTSGTSFSYPLRYGGVNQPVANAPIAFYKDVKDYDTQCGCGYISDPVPVSLRPACFHNNKPHTYIAPANPAHLKRDCDPYAIGNPYYATPYKVLQQPEITCSGWCSYPDISIKNGRNFP